MAYEITADDGKPFVKIRIHGPASFEEHLAARSEAYRVCADKNCPRLLVDLRDYKNNHEITTFARYDFGKTYKEEAPLPNIKMATVLPKDAKACTDVHFTITVGINRGADIAEFEHPEEAEEWLLDKAGNLPSERSEHLA